MSDILSLPPEIITLIASYLEVGDIVCLGGTCTGLRWVRFEALRRLRLICGVSVERMYCFQWFDYIRLMIRTGILETPTEGVDTDFIRRRIEQSSWYANEILRLANLETIHRFLTPDFVAESSLGFYLSALKNSNPVVRDHFIGPALEKHPNILCELVAHCGDAFTVPVVMLTQERLTWVVHAVRTHVHPDRQRSALLRILSVIRHGGKIAFFLEIAPLPLRNVLETASTSYLGWKAVGAHYLPLSRMDERLVRGAVSSWFEEHRHRNHAIAIAFGLMEDPEFSEPTVLDPRFAMVTAFTSLELYFRAVGSEGWPEGPVETWEDDGETARLAVIGRARRQCRGDTESVAAGWCTIL